MTAISRYPKIATIARHIRQGDLLAVVAEDAIYSGIVLGFMSDGRIGVMCQGEVHTFALEFEFALWSSTDQAKLDVLLPKSVQRDSGWIKSLASES